jgi:hypothetical protein
MPNYGMEINKMQSSYNAALCRAGVVTGLADGVKVPNGGLVFADNTSALPTSIYGTVDLNLENFKQYAASGNGAAYIIDSADVPEVTDANGNTYKVGADVTSLEFAQGKALRMRKLQPEDRLYIYDGNVTGTAARGSYLKPTADSFKFTADSSAPASGLALIVQAVLPLTAGLANKGNKYLCKVVSI